MSDQFLQSPFAMHKKILVLLVALVSAFTFASTMLVHADDYQTGEAVQSDAKKVENKTKEGSKKAGRKAKKKSKHAAKKTGEGMQDLGSKVSDAGK